MDEENRIEEERVEDLETERERAVEIEREPRRASWVIPVLAMLGLAVAGLAIYWSPMVRRDPAPFTPAPTRIGRRVVPPAQRIGRAGEQVPRRIGRNINERVPGAAATSLRDIERSIDRAREAVQDNDWSMARRETTRLGALWARFKPRATGVNPAIDSAAFDATYARLKANVNLRNRRMTMRELDRLRGLVRNV